MQRRVDLVDLEKMQKNNDSLAKIGFHTAENEPSKVVCCITPCLAFDSAPFYVEPAPGEVDLLSTSVQEEIAKMEKSAGDQIEETEKKQRDVRSAVADLCFARRLSHKCC